MRIVEDAVQDLLLRQFDRSNPHEPIGFETGAEPVERDFAPGSVLEAMIDRGGAASSPQRIVVGETSPQEVVLR